jgi:hypothetical protein
MSNRNVRSFQLTTVLIGLVALAPTAVAQTTGVVEMQFRSDLDQNHHIPMLDVSLSKALNRQFGVSAFALAMDQWAEVYVGPTFNPTQSMSLSLSLGGVQDANGKLVPRYAGSASVQGHGLFLIGVVEADTAAIKADLLYNIVATYSPTNALSIGLQDRRSDGLGPRVSLKLGSVRAWATWTPYLPETGTWRPGRVISGLQWLM